MEEERGAGISADLNWSHTIKIPLSPLQLQVQKLVISFAYNHDIVFLFSFCFGLHLLSGFLVHFLKLFSLCANLEMYCCSNKEQQSLKNNRSPEARDLRK